VIVQALCFYLFSGLAVAAAAMVIAARNPVHSVLFLILTFFNAAGLFVLLGAEFLAMILVVVYVGAVAVLFLFVVMMLDIDFASLRAGFMRYAPVGGAIGLVLFAELVLVGSAYWAYAPETAETRAVPIPNVAEVSNTEALGRVLYTRYFYAFQAAGLILLVAMIGAIVLTLRAREGVRRQTPASQLGRTKAESVAIVKIRPRSGVSV
jgi:NADH-quinone oxidoreductase subunit J